MYDRTGNYLIVAILIGMILGVVTVAIFGESMLPVKFLGDIFLNALKMVVIPLLFCSMIVGISNLGDVRKLGRTGLKTLLYFLVTSSIAVVIGLILVNLVQPGAGFGTFGAAVPESVSISGGYSFFTWLTEQIPANIINAAAETQVLPIIVFALIFGGVLTTLGPKGRPVITFFEGVNEAIMKIVHLIMWFAPIGIFGLVAGQLAANGGISGFSSVVSALGKYSLVVLLGLLIHGLVVLPLILKFIGGKNPVEYFVGMAQALMTAFATSSSSATLPVTMECVEENNDIDKRASSFVLPLGATINMDGTALYEAVAAMFIAQAYGIALPIWSQITIFATAVLASVGAAGIPQAGLVTMVLVLQAVGLPLEGIGLILAVDWFLDRCRTTVNVWGDSVGAAVIATTAEIGLVDRQKLKAVRSSRSGRFRDMTRRNDPRYKKKIEAPKPGMPRDRGSFKTRGKKRDESARDKNRRTSRINKKSDFGGEKRQPEIQQRDSGFHQTARREEYKPGEPSNRDKSSGSRPVKSDRNEAADSKRPSGGQEQKKTAYGRRRFRPPHAAKNNRETEPTPARSESLKAEKMADQPPAHKENPGFEIPKFPASILDDLGARERSSVVDTDTEEEHGVSDYGQSRPEVYEPESPADESGQENKREWEIDTGDNGDNAEKPADDFSRLDEAVLGTLTKLDKQPEFAPIPDEDDSPSNGDTFAAESYEETAEVSPEPEASPETPVAEDRDSDWETDSGSEIAATETPEIDEPSRKKETASDFTSIPDSVSDSDETDNVSDASDEDTESSESPDQDESKDETMRWGRPKQKKMSR